MTATVPVSKSLKQRLKQVCSELKEYRATQGISASLLAKKASITRVTLNKLEQGDIGVSVGVWLKVLSVLESTDKFFNLLSTAMNTKTSTSKKSKQLIPVKSSKISGSKKSIPTKKPVNKTKSKLNSSVKNQSKTKTKTNSKTKTKSLVQTRTKTQKPKTSRVTRGSRSKK